MATHLDRMAALGLNTILPDATSAAGDAFYPSGIIPRRVYADRDGFGVLVREAGRRGLRVYPVHCAMSCGGEQRMAACCCNIPNGLARRGGCPAGVYLGGSSRGAKMGGGRESRTGGAVG